VASPRTVRVQSGDRVLSLIQDNLAKAIDDIADQPLTGGVVVSGIPLVAGPNVVNHTLNRLLVGWYLVRNRANATVFDTQDSNLMPTKTLLLTASAATTVDIFVF
jgi:hypothetical protein